MPWIVPTIGTIVGGGLGFASSQSEQSAADAQAAKQHKYDKKVWKYNWKQAKRDFKFAKESVDIARQNEQAERSWRNQTAKNDRAHAMAIRRYEYRMQKRAFQKSEETYKNQLNFNNIAAQVAMESENRFLEEQRIATAFQNQDLFVQALREEGQAAASGQSGRSAGKAIQSVLAQQGRNQAILAESLVSAEKQYKVNLNKIGAEKYGADLQAEANRMLKPEIAPAIPKPILLPRTIFQKPQRPKKPPKPIKGAGGGSTAANALGSLSSLALNLGSIKWS